MDDSSDLGLPFRTRAAWSVWEVLGSYDARASRWRCLEYLELYAQVPAGEDVSLAHYQRGADARFGITLASESISLEYDVSRRSLQREGETVELWLPTKDASGDERRCYVIDSVE